MINKATRRTGMRPSSLREFCDAVTAACRIGIGLASISMVALRTRAEEPPAAVKDNESASAAPAEIRIIPKPATMNASGGFYSLTGATIVSYAPPSPEMIRLGQYLADLVAPATGLKLRVQLASSADSRGIVLRTDASRKDLGDEGYALVCNPKGVTITAAKPAGVFYGMQTLRQLLPVRIESRQKVEGMSWTVPCVSIEDRPRFKWRGYLLDPARNFRTKDDVKRYIDLLAFQKLNTLQIHLTDDQGWRIEIMRYPKLVGTGSRLPDYTGRKGEGWFYTQEDIKEIVSYASERYVTVVPEIELPGHCGAAIASYPELGCGGKHPGGWSAPLCVSQESTLEFAKNVLDEVISMFPSEYIHVGADEVPPGPWRGCVKCKPVMDKLVGMSLPADVPAFRVKVSSGGLPYHQDVSRMQGDFIRKIDLHLTAKGRRMVGWDEVLDGGLKTGSPAVVMAWRGDSAVRGASAQKRDAIVALHPLYYLDNETPIRLTYEYEPVPADLPAGDEKHVFGVQGNMWGETTSSLEKVDARSFPRLCAIAETGWSDRKDRNFDGFSIRLVDFQKRLKLLGVASGPVR